jgi:hypothetical protein
MDACSLTRHPYYEMDWVPAFSGMTHVVSDGASNWRHSREDGSPDHPTTRVRFKFSGAPKSSTLAWGSAT